MNDPHHDRPDRATETGDSAARLDRILSLLAWLALLAWIFTAVPFTFLALFG